MGGLERYALHIANGFAAYGAQVYLLSSSEKLKPITIDLHPNVKIIQLGRCSKWNFWAVLQYQSWVNTWLKENQVDLIFGLDRNGCEHAHRAGNGSHKAYLDLKMKGASWWKKLFIKLNPFHLLAKRIEKKTFEGPNLKCLIVNSNLVKNQIQSLYSIPKSKIQVVYNGVDLNQSKAYIEDPLDVIDSESKSTHQFLFVGNGYQRKGLDHILEALSKVKLRWKLTVVGKDKTIDKYVNLADTLGIIENVQFLGPQSNLWPIYKNADTCIIGSFYDPFANVTLEALVMGLHVISSKYNGGCEVLPKQCRVYDPNAPSNLVELLKEAISLGKKSEERVFQFRKQIKDFDINCQINKIVSCCLKL